MSWLAHDHVTQRGQLRREDIRVADDHTGEPLRREEVQRGLRDIVRGDLRQPARVLGKPFHAQAGPVAPTAYCRTDSTSSAVGGTSPSLPSSYLVSSTAAAVASLAVSASTLTT